MTEKFSLSVNSVSISVSSARSQLITPRVMWKRGRLCVCLRESDRGDSVEARESVDVYGHVGRVFINTRI